MGDFNARVGKDGGPRGERTSNAAGRLLVDIVHNHQLAFANLQTTASGTLFTRERSGNTSIIDYIVTPLHFLPSILCCETLPLQHSSDHFPILMVLKTASLSTTHTTKKRTTWNLRKANWPRYSYELHLKLIGWMATYHNSHDDVPAKRIESLWSSLSESILSSAQLSIPQSRITDHSKPWWSIEVNEKFIAQQRAEKHLRTLSANSVESFEALARLKSLKKEYKKAVRRSKRHANERLGDSLDRNLNANPKLFFHYVRKMHGNRSSIPAVIQHNGTEYQHTERVEAFRDFFAKIGDPKQNAEHYNSRFQSLVDHFVSSAMFEKSSMQGPPGLDARIHIKEVHLRVGKLKENKSPGVDEIRNEFLKRGGPLLHSVLTLLFNLVWSEQMVPKEWKIGVISPIFKGGSSSDINNYRPITLLSVVGKLFESILNARLYDWAEDNGKIDNNQGGFRRLHGCDDLLFALSEIFQRRREHKKHTFACFIDVQKAYDTVWHNGLWYRLWSLGVRGRTLSLLRFWYRDMASCVVVDGDRSDYFDVLQGVKQGSILSPLLYSFFINDVIKMMRRLNLGITEGGIWVGMLLYADDMVLLADSPEELQKMIFSLESFCSQYRFRLNPSKSKSFVAGESKANRCKRLATFGQFKMTNGRMEDVEIFKYLGVEIRKDGRWCDYLNRCHGKARSVANLLVALGMHSHGFSVPAALRLFESLVMPHLQFGCQVWEPSKTTAMNFERTQSRAYARILGCLNSTSLAYLRTELGQKSIYNRRKQIQLRFFGKLKGDSESKPMLSSDIFRLRFCDMNSHPQRVRGWVPMMQGVLSDFDLEEYWSTDILSGGDDNHGYFEDEEKPVDSLERWNQLVANKVAVVSADSIPGILSGDSRLTLFQQFHTQARDKALAQIEQQEQQTATKVGQRRRLGKAGIERAVTRDVRMWMDDIPSFSLSRQTIAAKAQLRSGVHCLEIHQGRLRGVERDQRLCCVCASSNLMSARVVESEVHHVLVCPGLRATRQAVFAAMFVKLWGTETGQYDAAHFLRLPTEAQFQWLVFPESISFSSPETSDIFEKYGRYLVYLLRRERSHILQI
jgi:hypothetical protein